MASAGLVVVGALPDADGLFEAAQTRDAENLNSLLQHQSISPANVHGGLRLLSRGLRVHTPEGDGEVVQHFADSITVNVAGQYSQFDPSDVTPIETAPF